jgi:hypothetical protein
MFDRNLWRVLMIARIVAACCGIVLAVRHAFGVI